MMANEHSFLNGRKSSLEMHPVADIDIEAKELEKTALPFNTESGMFLPQP